jgi:hypothetical protein
LGRRLPERKPTWSRNDIEGFMNNQGKQSYILYYQKEIIDDYKQTTNL